MKSNREELDESVTKICLSAKRLAQQIFDLKDKRVTIFQKMESENWQGRMIKADRHALF